MNKTIKVTVEEFCPNTGALKKKTVTTTEETNTGTYHPGIFDQIYDKNKPWEKKPVWWQEYNTLS